MQWMHIFNQMPFSLSL